jgi:hypothetical protein
MSTLPKASLQVATMALTSSKLVTSQVTAFALPPLAVISFAA